MSPQLSPGVETIEDRRTEEALDDGGHDRFSHYADKDKLTEAMVMGTPGDRAVRQGLGPQS